MSESIVSCLVFGTSAMHAYGHQWACQLVYNPRLREGMGLTDGEGVERLWSRLRKLIGVTRSSGVSIARLWLYEAHVMHRDRGGSGFLTDRRPRLEVTCGMTSATGYNAVYVVVSKRKATRRRRLSASAEFQRRSCTVSGALKGSHSYLYEHVSLFPVSFVSVSAHSHHQMPLRVSRRNSIVFLSFKAISRQSIMLFNQREL